jgi:hypothetical protein
MSTKPTPDEREVIKVDTTKVKKDDLMAIIYYVKVKSVNAARDEMNVTDLENGLSDINVRGKDLIQNSLSADFFGKEEKATMTRMAEILISSPNRPLTVCFKRKDGAA